MFEKLKQIFAQPNRDPFPDFLRGLAVIFMIQIHITELLLLPDPTYHLLEKWLYFLGGIPAAPIFLILMGYYQDRTNADMKKEFFRGIKIFLLGLSLNLLMNLSLLYKYFSQQIDVNIYSYIFGVDILLFAGLSYSVVAILRRKIRTTSFLVLLILMIYIIHFSIKDISMDNFEGIYFLSFFYRVSYWSYFPLIPWLVYPIIGIILNRTELFTKIIDKNFSSFFWIIYLILFFITIEFGLISSYDLDKYYNHNFIIFIYSLFILFGWIKLIKTIFDKFYENLFVKYLSWLGRNVTIVYFLQWIIIGNIGTYLYKSLTVNSCALVLLVVLFSVTISTYLYQLSRS